MDPDIALDDARKAYEAFIIGANDQDAAEDLAKAFRALDGWLSNGGFKPRDWH